MNASSHSSQQPGVRPDWLLAEFIRQTAGASDCVAVSPDGLLLAASADHERENTRRLAAIVAGLASLTSGASELFEFGLLKQIIVEMENGHFFVMSTDDGIRVGVLAVPGCDIGMIAFEMALMSERVGRAFKASPIE